MKLPVRIVGQQRAATFAGLLTPPGSRRGVIVSGPGYQDPIGKTRQEDSHEFI